MYTLYYVVKDDDGQYYVGTDPEGLSDWGPRKLAQRFACKEIPAAVASYYEARVVKVVQS